MLSFTVIFSHSRDREYEKRINKMNRFFFLGIQMLLLRILKRKKSCHSLRHGKIVKKPKLRTSKAQNSLLLAIYFSIIKVFFMLILWFVKTFLRLVIISFSCIKLKKMNWCMNSPLIKIEVFYIVLVKVWFWFYYTQIWI